MIIRADEHISPNLVKIINNLCIADGWSIDHVNDVGHNSTSDVYWITEFAKNGGNVIITADTDFCKLPNQVNAVFSTGIKVVLLSGKYGRATRYEQISHIVLCWPAIERAILSMRQRECYQTNWNSIKIQELTKVHLDFHKAQKKIKKSKD